MGDFFSWLGDTASDIWGGISSTATGLWDDVSGIFGGADSGDVFSEQVPGFDLGGAGFDPGSVLDQFIPQAGPADQVIAAGDNGGGLMNGGMMQTAGSLGPAMATLGTAGVWLGSVLARAGTAAGAIFRGANGVSVRMAQLWPYVKKYGPFAVATGLGISAQQLATLLENAPRSGGGRGRRGRGISARDVKTTRRTLKTIRKLYHMMPTRRTYGGGGGYYRRRYRR